MHHVPPRVHTPPATPLPCSQFPSTSSHSSPLNKFPFQSMQTPSQSPPPAYDESFPIGPGHRFNLTRTPPSRDWSSRQSSISAQPSIPSRPVSRARSDRERSISREPSHLRRIMSDGDFTVEELANSEAGYPSDVEVIQPDSCEDALSNAGESVYSEPESPRGSDTTGIEERLRQLGCHDPGFVDKQKGRKEKRLAYGKLKRELCDSLESDTDMEDVSGFNAREMAKSGRRQRLRTSSSHSDDGTLTPEEHIPEVSLGWETGDEDLVRPTTAGSDTNVRAVETFPFHSLEDIMQIDASPSRESTPR
ncbi:MAG: hypothetical protein M1820_007926 [Bogoriella megaspora]|nr:MAG: hypothetical protein M1820_007926 [Bogoriella megaspora]